MLLTVKKVARELRMELHQVYYLLSMGEIAAFKIGRAWRLDPESVDEYVERHPEIKNRKTSGYFIYPGDSGFLFGCLHDRIPLDPEGRASGVERRRGKLVRRQKRPFNFLLQKLKSLGQLELFAE